MTIAATVSQKSISKPPGPNSRPARRSGAIRKSILLDLGTQERISKRQALAARRLDADLAANTGRSLCRISRYEPRVDAGGHSVHEPQIGVAHAARDRLDRLQAYLHDHERALLGQIMRLNFEPTGGIASLAVETSFRAEQLRNAAILGRIQSLLDSVASFYQCVELHRPTRRFALPA